MTANTSDGTLLRHTGELGTAEFGEIRALLDDAFDGDFADEDFEHALGGMHVLVRYRAPRAGRDFDDRALVRLLRISSVGAAQPETLGDPYSMWPV
ncbi:hypothetical protein ACFWBH_18315 [Streptomyces sp. NPDC059999]|uniref:hypothetical protein n=1 Tax=Streptomyces sp. NPDC059999 TaxID=3347030 RepID=UPI0036D017C6